MISIKDLSVRYDGLNVLDNFSLNLTKGELYALVGVSGSGKSTLLKVICGIKKNYTGVIEYDGVPISQSKISIGYVPQNYGLLDWKTVKDNIALPSILGKSKKNGGTLIKEISAVLEITDLMDRYPGQLSGGQKQRVALARAFALEPDLLLMDEPFSALDAFTSAASQELFLKIWSEHRVTSLFITHNINEAVSIGKHILIMDKNNGRINRTIENHTFANNSSGISMEKMKLADDILHTFEASV